MLFARNICIIVLQIKWEGGGENVIDLGRYNTKSTWDLMSMCYVVVKIVDIKGGKPFNNRTNENQPKLLLLLFK